jgi:hypothetical protein
VKIFGLSWPIPYLLRSASMRLISGGAAAFVVGGAGMRGRKGKGALMKRVDRIKQGAGNYTSLWTPRT